MLRLAVERGLQHIGRMIPFRATEPALWPPILALLREAFAYMEGRIDPPSSLHDLTPEAVSRHVETGEIWVTGDPVVACLFLTPKPEALYLGKLAVAAPHRGQGLARRLVDLAEARAVIHDLPVLELQTRVELAGNHAAFRALGFVETGRTSHPGFARPTSITFRRQVRVPEPAALSPVMQ
jgi:predicted N-acetyltransferase YhbS